MSAIRLREAKSHTLDEHINLLRSVVRQSMKDPESRMLAVALVSGTYDYKRDARTGKETPMVSAWGKNFRAPAGVICRARDADCEVERIWDFVVLNIRYVYDSADDDTFSTLKVMLLTGGEDCFPEGTLMLRDDHTLVPVEQLKPGMKIWGKDRWSEVTAQVCKGVKPVTAIRMNNGSWMHLTEDHKVYVAVCHKHTSRTEASGPCSCPVSEREVVRMPVAELQPDMVLIQPAKIDMYKAASTVEACALAELTGLYLSDGWCDDHRVGISGKDGHPKEAQKHRVVELAKTLGYSTGWQPRYIHVYGNELVEHLAPYGTRAYNKQLPHLRYTPDEAAVLLQGIMADSGAQTGSEFARTFTTTSRMLAVQTRVLHRMHGVSCGWAYIENHGGLGKHPIWRLHTRAPQAHGEKLLRVKEIVRNAQEATVYDITTDDHYVYLPEHDVTVSNCDGMTIAFATLLKHVGFHVIARVISTQEDPNAWVHIYPLVGLPKDSPTHWVPLDATIDGFVPGDEYKGIGKHRDFKL